MRLTPACLAAVCVLGMASLLDGCANRGMVAPSDGSSATGGAGAGGQPVAATGGAAGRATGGAGGRGGATGTGGLGGGGNRDAGCGMTDARADRASHCTALFSFESGTQGATLGTDQQAFKQPTISGANTFCGSGALAVGATFSGTTGLTTKGELDIPLGADGGAINLSGKTLTVHATATGTCGTDLKLTVVLVTSSGSLFPLRNVPITSSWTTSLAVLSSDAGSGISSVVSLQIDVSSFTGYAGTIYLDEIDIN
ncbi:MAG TPA: hypothetical protein VHH90_02005 [Polyangia bacterium]|nr:hypothetical protein [Polyangia bacterium]